MKAEELFKKVKGRYVDPKYPFQDRLYFLFGTAGVMSAGAAFIAAVCSGLPRIAAVASMVSFLVMLVLMSVSFCMNNVFFNRIFCSLFLNFFMFPVLFWVTGGIDCGMVFYFIMGISVAALILEGRLRLIVATLALIFDGLCLDLGFRYPEFAYALSYEERRMDMISSFGIVALFIVAVIMIMSHEYEREHQKALEHAAWLNHEAITDGLTTLYNQRFLMDSLAQLKAACDEDGIEASIILMDIDDFKGVNDVHGHIRGDQVLARFAAILKEQAGERCTAFRYGGEEFIVTVEGMKLEYAVKLGESIRQAVVQDGKLSELTGTGITLSGGVARYKKGMSVEAWIGRADANLYRAKKTGKNKIIG